MTEPCPQKVIRAIAILAFIGAGFELMFGMFVLQGFGWRGSRDLNFCCYVPFIAMSGALVASGFGLWQLHDRGRRQMIVLCAIAIIAAPLFFSLDETGMSNVAPFLLSTMLAIHGPLVVTPLVLKRPIWDFLPVGMYLLAIFYLRRRDIRNTFVGDELPPL